GIDMRQVAGHCAFAEEQLLGDLPVRPAGGSEDGDAPLGRRQPLCLRASADARELVTRLLDPAGSSELLERFERRAERLPGSALLPCPPSDDAESQQGAGASECIANLLVLCGRLLQ